MSTAPHLPALSTSLNQPTLAKYYIASTCKTAIPPKLPFPIPLNSTNDATTKNPLTRNSTVKLLAQLAIYQCTPDQILPTQSPNSHNISPIPPHNTSKPLNMFSATSKEPSITAYATSHQPIPHSPSVSPTHLTQLTPTIANHTPASYSSSTTALSYGNLPNNLSPHCHQWNLNISNSLTPHKKPSFSSSSSNRSTFLSNPQSQSSPTPKLL